MFCFFSCNTCYLSSGRKKKVSSKWRESAIDNHSTSFTFSLPLAVESSCDELLGSIRLEGATNSSHRHRESRRWNVVIPVTVPVYTLRDADSKRSRESRTHLTARGLGREAREGRCGGLGEDEGEELSGRRNVRTELDGKGKCERRREGRRRRGESDGLGCSKVASQWLPISKMQ